MKWRNSKERELLASGGSRDQTLPNKNNPNPDLSDARSDRPASLSPPISPIEYNQQTPELKNSNSELSLEKNRNNLKSEQDEKIFNGNYYDRRQIESQSQFKLDERVQMANQPSVRNDMKMDYYYDEYDSHSDSDEEINVM